MANLKTIVVPQESLELGPESKFDFYMLIRWLVESQPAYNMNAVGARAGYRLMRLMENRPETITLDMEDWTILKDTIESPEKGYPVRPAQGLTPMIDAVTNASDE